jgi:hypothetical protein
MHYSCEGCGAGCALTAGLLHHCRPAFPQEDDKLDELKRRGDKEDVIRRQEELLKKVGNGRGSGQEILVGSGLGGAGSDCLLCAPLAGP